MDSNSTGTTPIPVGKLGKVASLRQKSFADSNSARDTTSRYGQNGKVTAFRVQVILSVRIGLPAR